VRYPGERDVKTRRENLANGIPVNDEVWARITRL
jgi:LDH2 family malate/lactate/ureidoglycolate dehydrogenase